MRRSLKRTIGCLAAAVSVGCAQASVTDTDAVGLALTVGALSVCDETVPADRNIDGIPAYAQCEQSNSSAIYSNNGVDTSTTQMGSDWVRTQWSGGYQCTELAHRYLHFRWQVKWIPNGNAGFWCDTEPPASSGVEQTMTPVHGDIMVLAPGSCGADPTTGHVNVIDEVNGDRLIAVEQNRARRGPYQLSCAKCFLHVVANDGTPAPAAGTAASATGSAGAGSAPGVPGMPGMPGIQGGAARGGGPAPADGMSMSRPSASGWPAAAAGAAAPAANNGNPSAPASAATPPAAAAPAMQPATASAPATQPVGTATMPLSGVVMAAQTPSQSTHAATATSTRMAPPAESACSLVGGVRSKADGGPLPTLALLFGTLLCVRRRRRRAFSGGTVER